MLNAVFDETSGNVIPEDHGLQAQKSLLVYNSNFAVSTFIIFQVFTNESHFQVTTISLY